MNVYLQGKALRLDPARMLGKGGEAEVYDLGDGRALKVFKPPEHPDFTGQPEPQRAARERISEHQAKLRAFPGGLPRSVVGPVALATDRKGQTVLGYAMPLVAGAEPLLRYGEAGFRRAGASAAQVVELFRGLHRTLTEVHATGVVVGDFNDLNVLVRNTAAFLVDADSFQYGPWPCRVFTERFVDPLLCDPGASAPLLVRPLSAQSDWYAFHALLFQSLLCVGPFGGIHRPKEAARRCPPGARPLRRITVFDPEVQYPKPAFPRETLPDEALHHFERVFAKDARGVFPVRLLDGLAFRRCPQCGGEHARTACPTCRPHATAAAQTHVVVRGQVTATRLFETRGVVLHACIEGGELRWLCHEDGRFVREDGAVVLEGELDPLLQVGIRGRETYLARGGELRRLSPDRPPERLSVDAWGNRATFACNAAHAYWASGGRLLRDGALGPEPIGEVLMGQTLLWVGPTFGVGLYRAGAVSVGFTFDAARRGLRDTVALPPLRGHLVDAACALAAERAWLLLATHEGGRTTHHCVVVTREGAVLATAQAPAGDGSWLGTLHGRCAAGEVLLAATDEGLVRLEASGGAIAQTRTFPDTEPFVDAGTALLSARQGLCAVHPRGITALQLR